MSSFSIRSLLTERLKLVTLLLLIYTILSFTQGTWRIDQVFYDAHMKYWQSSHVDDVVIVSIDEESLRQFGRWPWSRELHAELLNRFTLAGTKAVVLDLIFAEPETNNPLADVKLKNAVSDNGKVFLPVIVEQNRGHGQLIETMPLPQLVQSAAGIGHVHIELDQDGIARSVFLKEGLERASWFNVNHVLYRYLYPNAQEYLPGARNPNEESVMNAWSRDYQVLIPFVGPPGHFSRISYSQIFEEDFPLSLLKNKIIFVGATATGMGDMLPTPVSGQRQAMPGVEINANIFHAIRTMNLIEPVSLGFQYWFYIILVLLPVIIYPILSPRNGILMAVSGMLFTLVACVLLLRFQQIWIPPMAAIITILSSYPLWSWRRLEFTLSSLNDELRILNKEKSKLSIDIDKVKQEEFQIVAKDLGILTLKLKVGSTGETHNLLRDDYKGSNIESYASRLRLTSDDDSFLCELLLELPGPLSTKQQDKLLSFLLRIIPVQKPRKSTLEVIEQRIGEVKDTTIQLQLMQQFVNDSIEQMSDGMIITNAYGTIVTLNRNAYELLGLNPHVSLHGKHIINMRDDLAVNISDKLFHHFVDSLTSRRTIQESIELTDTKRVLVSVNPFFNQQSELLGLIVTLTDVSELIRQQKQKEELINFLSHDLRTPLVSSLAQLEMVSQKQPDESNWKEFLSKQKTQNQKTLTLVEEFVQLSRAENLNTTSFHELNIVDAVDNAIDNVWGISESKSIKIAADYSNSFLPVLGDFDTLERVVVNLLSNALKYSPDNTVVTVTLKKDNQAVILCVADEGYGISEEELPVVFSRFSRFNKQGKRNETSIGLGLSFVKTSLDKHQATISVKSEINKGSQFCIRFPLLSN